jgi:hypothetical protein
MTRGLPPKAATWLLHWASEARTTDTPPEANTKDVSETARNNDLNMKFPIFLCEEVPAFYP